MNKPRSGQDGIFFFSVRKVGLTVAYRRADHDTVEFGVAWKADGDQQNAPLARKIALSRLESVRDEFCEYAVLTDGKERNAIVKAVDKLVKIGYYNGKHSGKTSISSRWMNAINAENPDHCNFITSLVN